MQLVFIATRGDEYSGDIAIDDLKVYTGACSRWNPRFISASFYLAFTSILRASLLLVSSCDLH